VVVPEPEGPTWFIDGTFGKQRRQYELPAPPPGTGTIAPGFCDPMVGVKAGPMLWFADERVSFAPAALVAFVFSDLGDYDYADVSYNRVSMLLEGVVNYHFGDRRAYVGTGLGWWDAFDSNHGAATWIVNFGVPVGASTSLESRTYFIAEGRLFLDVPNGYDSNYQVWAGIRHLFRR
jgi:hypothetical protein